MGKISETFLKKYGIAEYVLFIAGIAIIGRVVYSLLIADFKTMTWAEIGVITFVMSIGILAVAAPKTMVDFAKKKTKLDNKDNCDH